MAKTKQKHSNINMDSMLPKIMNWIPHTLVTVSLTAGTGNRGKDVWKLYNMGLRPEKSFTRVWRKTKSKYTLQFIMFHKGKWQTNKE